MKKKFTVFSIIGFLILATIAFAGINDRFSRIELEEDDYIFMPELSTAPATPIAGWGNVYAKDNNLYFKNDQGVVTNVSPGSGIQDIPAGGTSTVLVLTNSVFTVGADAGGDIGTLANGTAGQIAYIICEDATGTFTITPATFNGGTSVTFNALGDSVVLMYNTGLGWSIVGGNSYAII